MAGTPIWQRNYYERIIRNKREMDAIWRYLEANPVYGGDDEENPNGAAKVKQRRSPRQGLPHVLSKGTIAS